MQVAFLVFENEGHDVIKFENKVRCYNAIAQFLCAASEALTEKDKPAMNRDLDHCWKAI